MALSEPAPVDTRHLFRPVSTELIAVLRQLGPADWEQRTVAGTWRVRDVLAHLADLTFRRLSFHRDAMAPPPPTHPITSERDFVGFINGLNAQWVAVARRFSPRALTDMFDLASRDLADWFEALPLEAPALFAVSWAGEQASAGWFDIGREFTELWHHQQQIRMAVGAPPLADPRYLRAVIDVSVRGLPHAYRAVPAEPGETLAIDVTGPSGGQWTLRREAQHWRLFAGKTESPTARVSVADDDAWQLLFNALGEGEAERAVRVEGRAQLTAPFLRARSVIV
jgi:uncharacterized protein (TIGR03083 family)